MTQTRFSLIARALLLSAALLLLAVGTASAQVVTQLVVSDVDTSAFPDITVTFRAALEGGGSATDLSSLALTENGEAIDGFPLVSIEAGHFAAARGPVSNMGRLDCKEASLIALKGLARDADFFATVSDEAAQAATGRLAGEGIATTPSGAAGVAALLDPAIRKAVGAGREAHVLTIISEGGDG